MGSNFTWALTSGGSVIWMILIAVDWNHPDVTYPLQKAIAYAVVFASLLGLTFVSPDRWAWGWRIMFGLSLFYVLHDLYRHWRKRRKWLSKAIGEKAKLIRAKLVRTMRERARPRLVPIPVPVST